jgi:rSAM/selenodomain-associated transferase 2
MISIIIPAYNEEDALPNLVRHLTANAEATDVEIIVADGGSTDQTKVRCEKVGAQIVECTKKGRAAQMNEGAKQAKGEVLFFLHADTYPPEEYVEDITVALQKFDAGCYRLSFDDDHPLMNLYSWFTRFDVDIFRFGDQGLFVKKDVFQQAGTFDEQLIVMEDQEMVKSIKASFKFTILRKKVITSARKYKEVGRVKLQLVFGAILCMYYLGVSQQKLVEFYKARINT